MNRSASSVFEGLNVQLVEPPAQPFRGNFPHLSKSEGNSPIIGQSGGNSPNSIFDGLDVISVDAPQQQDVSPDEVSRDEASQGEDTWGQLVARTGKSAIAGAGGGVIDAATAVYNVPAALTNAGNDLNKDNPFEIDPVSEMPIQKASGERVELPLIPSATEAIDEGIDHATGGYTRTPEQEKWFQEGIKFASSVASGGEIGRAHV